VVISFRLILADEVGFWRDSSISFENFTDSIHGDKPLKRRGKEEAEFFRG
jgi:hypothetical protein